MPYETVLITGANRGIGLEFVKQSLRFSPSPKAVIATTRAESKDLLELQKQNPNLHILTYDSVKFNELDSFAEKVKNIVGDSGLSLLVNNAAILQSFRNTLETLEPEILMRHYENNSVGPLMLVQKLLPALRQSSKAGKKTTIANISSLGGSIDDNQAGTGYAYRGSKCALNMFTKSLSVDLKADNIIALALSPGWVRTDMGGEKATTLPEQSVAGMLSVITEFGIDKTGTFTHYTGKDLKW